MVTEIYDIETLSNLFTYTGFCLQDNTVYQFVIHKSNNQVKELYTHLKRDKSMYQVGYNNEKFDYPVLHYFLLNYRKFQDLDGETIAVALYQEAQRVIEDKFSGIWDNKKLIHQTDLMSIWHFDAMDMLTSLKDLQFAMQMENIEDMPIQHQQWIKAKDIPMILSYNKNDVEATYLFLLTTLGQTEHSPYKGKNKIQLRAEIGAKFKTDVHNLADVPMGEHLMLTLYSRATMSNPWEIRKLRTHRSAVSLADCIPSWANIESKEFNVFLDLLKNTVVSVGGTFKSSIIFHGISFDFGLGGSHGCIKAGVYDADEEYALYDMDVASLYPSIAKSLGIYPAHLGPEFIELYSQFIDDRIAEKHVDKFMRDDVLIEGYKLILNGTYGKTGYENSFLYDLLYMYKTTIAGQLFISMWAERMVKAVPELVFIQINTDGISVRVKRSDIPKLIEVCDQLTVETGLIIEDAYYNKMIMRDVNNYCAVFEGSTHEYEQIQYKGCFEIDKNYNKDLSMKIVPIALKEYFIYGVPIEQTIKEHTNIYDFCLRWKVNSSSRAFWTYLDDGGDVKELDLGRTTRYFVSTKGGSLAIYYNGSKSLNRRHVGYSTTLFNKYYEAENYNIDYNFYAVETRKIINAVEDLQLSLF